MDRKIDLDTQYVALRLIPSDEWERMSDVDDSEKPDSYQSRLEMYRGHDIKEEELVENGEYRKFLSVGALELVNRHWFNTSFANGHAGNGRPI